ncbi:MAG: hypothetical protein IK081_02190 [Lachnospiraceae bacterium]|nr:hypothetical protein [Lachnospiraceae bacterium]
MSNVLQFLKTIDDEYLTGLSNKGIVKRSYKDLETTDVQVTEQGEEILGQCGDAQVTLKLPITNSTCSCPSTSICKHVIMTILAAQKLGDVSQENANVTASAAASVGDAGSENGAASPENANTTANAGNASKENVTAGEPLGNKVAEPKDELLEVPAERMKKSVGNKDWIKLLTQTDFEQDFEMTEGKMLTVRNLKTEVTVKLCYPLELSTCSACHDDKLCVHKAAALLAYQVKKGAAAVEELMDAAAQQTEEFDEESVPDTLADLRIFLEDLLMAGSARLSTETPLGLERLALRAHNAKLPDLEEKLRVLAESVAGYLGRKAKITASDLMRKIAECYGLTERMENMIAGGKSVYSLAGTFRSDYVDVPELLLHGVGMRAFESASGYAGKTLYFFEEKSKTFYTYTVARPTIYEKGTRRSHAAETVPWGLNCSLSQLSTATVRLRGGKANAGRRLSSTSTAHADLITVSGALPEGIGETIYDDFEALWKAYLAKTKETEEELPEADKLFLIRPGEMLDVHYDEVNQKLVFWLEDLGGRRLRGELAYSKQEEMAIRSLERLEKKLQRKEEEMPVFLGVFYASEGECCFYPIETIEGKRLAE